MNTIGEFEIYWSSRNKPQHLLNDKLSFESNIFMKKIDGRGDRRDIELDKGEGGAATSPFDMQ